MAIMERLSTVADTVPKKLSFRLTFVRLLVVNSVSVAAVYAPVINDGNIRSLVAVTLLAVVVVAQSLRCELFVPTLCWVATIPITIALAFLIATFPALDWSGPGEPDQISLTPIVPVITVMYATGFTLIAGTVYWGYLTIRKRNTRSSR